MKKIACILYRTLGDVVLCNTLAKEIKKKYPESHLTWYVNEEYAEVITFSPDIDEIACPPNKDFILKEVSSGIYDEVFWFAQETVEDNIWHQVDKYRHQHLVDFYAQRCGFKITERREYMYPQKQDFTTVDAILAERKIPTEKMCAIHTATLVPSKNWDKFLFLYKELKLSDYAVLQVGGLKDVFVVSEAEDFRKQVSLNQLAALLSRCKFFVGLDSGVSYISSAMDIPTYVLMGPTIPTTSGPIGSKVKPLVATVGKECEVIRCHGNCKLNNPCINNIPLKAILNVLAKDGF